ncbi:DUF1097 domain-containing protein [Amphritea sp. 2_MG-2023]|uniref:DUF1097 domain-containing protein n=1 Tax=Amphritea TaxID=515417 RepID=UPI001C076452|nr:MULTISPECIES: DUF1097 domain-containing protein [Amphritea]MBU2967324.1 DUF1097 domain-containing protein [Amphritea atlantica]MDO6420472.1 DUF1097 domain-containing protein [Amphritea sp. 2_MG-2023]
MKQPLATAIGVGIFGGIATAIFVQVGTLLIWAAFIAWASYFAIGGNSSVIKLNITSNVFGVIVAWLTALLVLANPSTAIPASMWVGLCVFASIVVYISASKVAIFSSIPAVTFGYATTFAFLSQTPNAFSYNKMLSANFENVLIIVPISMVIGTFFAAGSGWLSGILAGEESRD